MAQRKGNGKNKNRGGRKKKSGISGSIIALAVFLVVIALGITAVCWYPFSYDKVFTGVRLNGENLSGMSKIDVEKYIDEQFNDTIQSKSINFTCSTGKKTIPLKDFDYKVDSSELSEKIFNEGRTGNALDRFVNVYNLLFGGNDVSATYTMDEEKLKLLIYSELEKFNKDASSPTVNGYNIPEQMDKLKSDFANNKVDDLKIIAGENGYSVTVSDIENAYIDALKRIEETDFSSDIVVSFKFVEPEAADIENIYNETKRDVKNAVFDYYENKVVENEVIGISYDWQSAQEKLNEGVKFIEVKVEYNQPTVTAKYLEEKKKDFYKDVIGYHSSRVNTSDVPRTINVKLSGEKCNLIIGPGEEFSYNSVVGQRTAAAGFQKAGVFIANEIAEGIGGGICQISSTIYAAALKAEMDITERYHHMFTVSYMPDGMDATVSWGSLDFKFVNNRDFPIKIVTEVVNGYSNVTIYGIEDRDYEVKFESKVIATTPFVERTVETFDIPVGTTKKKQSGYIGKTVELWKIVLDSEGKEIERSRTSKDTYKPCDTIYQIGVEKPETPTPTP